MLEEKAEKQRLHEESEAIEAWKEDARDEVFTFRTLAYDIFNISG